MADERAAYGRADGGSRAGDSSNGRIRPHRVGKEEGVRSDAPVVSLAIYVSEHCPICVYAREVADLIRMRYPAVVVDVIDVADARAAVPEAVFATPTYLLEGRVWSLGNPSEELIRATFG